MVFFTTNNIKSQSVIFRMNLLDLLDHPYTVVNKKTYRDTLRPLVKNCCDVVVNFVVMHCGCRCCCRLADDDIVTQLVQWRIKECEPGEGPKCDLRIIGRGRRGRIWEGSSPPQVMGFGNVTSGNFFGTIYVLVHKFYHLFCG